MDEPTREQDQLARSGCVDVDIRRTANVVRVDRRRNDLKKESFVESLRIVSSIQFSCQSFRQHLERLGGSITQRTIECARIAQLRSRDEEGRRPQVHDVGRRSVAVSRRRVWIERHHVRQPSNLQVVGPLLRRV
jgi:hypothetical protein